MIYKWNKKLCVKTGITKEKVLMTKIIFKHTEKAELLKKRNIHEKNLRCPYYIKNSFNQ